MRAGARVVARFGVGVRVRVRLGRIRANFKVEDGGQR